ncbi:hypothetical protein [Streptomyces sp. NPDC059003]|uniref:hypothetical protein n=1 Tax=Streptomyces sp. NPDC059003 TaxID=3346691 RepID=UPI0036A5217F
MMITTQTSDRLVTSYAQPPRGRTYITGMRQPTTARHPGQPVRVYLSVPPAVHERRPSWPSSVDRIRTELPDGIELVQYRDAFDPTSDHSEQWTAVADTLGGPVVIGIRRDPREQALGLVARQELSHTVNACKTVLLPSPTRGLVPVLDRKPRRADDEPHQHLTAPPAWNPALQTVLAALTPEPAATTPQRCATETGNERATATEPRGDEPTLRALRPRNPKADKAKATSPHLAHPFATPSL